MRDALPSTPDGPARHGLLCQACHRVVVTSVEGLFHNPERGSRQRFCSPTCRQSAYRRRQAGVPETTPPQPRGGRNRSLRERDQD